MKNIFTRTLFAAVLWGAASITLAGDAASCLECHEPAEDWEGMTAEQILKDAKAPGNKRHADNIALSDEQLQEIIAQLLSAE